MRCCGFVTPTYGPTRDMCVIVSAARQDSACTPLVSQLILRAPSKCLPDHQMIDVARPVDSLAAEPQLLCVTAAIDSHSGHWHLDDGGEYWGRVPRSCAAR